MQRGKLCALPKRKAPKRYKVRKTNKAADKNGSAEKRNLHGELSEAVSMVPEER